MIKKVSKNRRKSFGQTFSKLAESRGFIIWSLSVDIETLKGASDRVPALKFEQTQFAEFAANIKF